jgi:hypothetical protein
MNEERTGKCFLKRTEESRSFWRKPKFVEKTEVQSENRSWRKDVVPGENIPEKNPSSH